MKTLVSYLCIACAVAFIVGGLVVYAVTAARLIGDNVSPSSDYLDSPLK